jgi:hypothetical protein
MNPKLQSRCPARQVLTLPVLIQQYLQFLCVPFRSAGPAGMSHISLRSVTMTWYVPGLPSCPDSRHTVWWMERHLLDWISCDRINLRCWGLMSEACFPWNLALLKYKIAKKKNNNKKFVQRVRSCKPEYYLIVWCGDSCHTLNSGGVWFESWPSFLLVWVLN